MSERRGADGADQTDGLPQLWHALYSRVASGRADGFFRRGVRGVLPVSGYRSKSAGRDLPDGREQPVNGTPSGFACPAPAVPDGQRITLAHGEGGRLTRRLIEDHIL